MRKGLMLTQKHLYNPISVYTTLKENTLYNDIMFNLYNKLISLRTNPSFLNRNLSNSIIRINTYYMENCMRYHALVCIFRLYGAGVCGMIQFVFANGCESDASCLMSVLITCNKVWKTRHMYIKGFM